MVVLEIDVKGIAIFEAKRDTPVLADCDRPVTRPIPFKLMQIEAGKVHGFDFGSN